MELVVGAGVTGEEVLNGVSVAGWISVTWSLGQPEHGGGGLLGAGGA